MACLDAGQLAGNIPANSRLQAARCAPIDAPPRHRRNFHSPAGARPKIRTPHISNMMFRSGNHISPHIII
jgi:hypothetical protein